MIETDVDVLASFMQFGGTDGAYLRAHLPRFAETTRRVLTRVPLTAPARILDIGAHWLHQSVPYARMGHAVTALDGEATFSKDEVRAAAHAYGIELLVDDNIEQLTALRTIAADTFDLVLFTEIIEHLTFNPIEMWREIHRVMKPGAHLVITTPNYYALRGRAWHWLRFLRGHGAGVDVRALLHQPTFAHHWKEYSLRELKRYFSMISNDFSVIEATHVGKYAPASTWHDHAARCVEKMAPMLRPNLYLLLALGKKQAGVTLEPKW